MGILDSCLFGSGEGATDPALSSVVIDDGEGGGGGGGNGASKDLLSASLAQSGILDDAVGDGVVSLVQINVCKNLCICFDQRVHVLNALINSSIVSHSPNHNPILLVVATCII